MNTLDTITNFTVWPTIFWCWTVVFIYPRMVKGSYRRYRMRSILRPLQWVALANYVMDAAVRWNKGEHFWFGFQVLNIIFAVWIIHNFENSDEDDWWSKTGKRIKRWVKRTARSLVPKVQVPVRVEAR